MAEERETPRREGGRERCRRRSAPFPKKRCYSVELPPDCLFSSHHSPPPPLPVALPPPPPSLPTPPPPTASLSLSLLLTAPSLRPSMVSATSSLQQPGGCYLCDNAKNLKAVISLGQTKVCFFLGKYVSQPQETVDVMQNGCMQSGLAVNAEKRKSVPLLHLASIVNCVQGGSR